MSPKERYLKYGSEKILVEKEIFNAANLDRDKERKKQKRLADSGVIFKEILITDNFTSSKKYNEESGAEISFEDIVIERIIALELWKFLKSNLTDEDYYIIHSYYKEDMTDEEIGKSLNKHRTNIVKRRKKTIAILGIHERQLRKIYES